MVSTYVVLPAVTAMLFGAAALPPLIAVGRSSLLLAVVLAAVWLVLFVALEWDGNLLGIDALVALVTFALAHFAAVEISRATGWHTEALEVGLVELAMVALAAVNQVLCWRRRER